MKPNAHGIEPKKATTLSSSFGGGMGRLREVRGAVSGMFMVAGCLYGYSRPGDYDGKKAHYERIQFLAKEFEMLNNSIVCRTLLGLSEGKDRQPANYSRKEDNELSGATSIQK